MIFLLFQGGCPHGWRQLRTWMSCQFITGPCVSINGSGPLLNGTWAVLWKCSSAFHTLFAWAWTENPPLLNSHTTCALIRCNHPSVEEDLSSQLKTLSAVYIHGWHPQHDWNSQKSRICTQVHIYATFACMQLARNSSMMADQWQETRLTTVCCL